MEYDGESMYYECGGEKDDSAVPAVPAVSAVPATVV